MWLVDCHSWMEVALSLWLINVKTEIDHTLGSARFIDTIVWGQDIDFTTKWLDLWNTNAIGSNSWAVTSFSLGGQWKNDHYDNRMTVSLRHIKPGSCSYKSITIETLLWKVNTLNSFKWQLQWHWCIFVILSVGSHLHAYPDWVSGVSNRWTGIWNGTVELNMEWNGEYS